MNDLVAGFLKFRETGYHERTELFHQLAHAQSPGALFIACSDSRLVPELVTQQEPGDLFVIRNAGNIVPSYGPEPGGVIGHGRICGRRAGRARCRDLRPLRLRRDDGHRHRQVHRPHAGGVQLAALCRLRQSRQCGAAAKPETATSSTRMVRENVIAQLANLRTHPSVRSR